MFLGFSWTGGSRTEEKRNRCQVQCILKFPAQLSKVEGCIRGQVCFTQATFESKSEDSRTKCCGDSLEQRFVPGQSLPFCTLVFEKMKGGYIDSLFWSDCKYQLRKRGRKQIKLLNGPTCCLHLLCLTLLVCNAIISSLACHA